MTPLSAAPRAGNFRWSICGLLFFSVAINYIDRNIIGILKMPLSQELGWSETDYAHIAAAFQFAYAAGYLFGGRMMDRWGAKKGLPFAVASWSLAAAAHGLCSLLPKEAVVSFAVPFLATTSQAAAFVLPVTVLGFISARVALGLAEGGNFPGAIKVVAEWFPAKERALATGLFNAGTNVGAIICPFAVPRMYEAWGWDITFYATGALGIVWLGLWWWLYDNPETHPRLTVEERNYIQEGKTAVEPKRASVPWLALLKYRAVWAYLAASILAGPVWNIYMFFLPDFLQKRFKLDLVSVGDWTALFYFVASFGGVGFGWWAGKLMGLGWSVNKARKISLLCCAVAVVPIYMAPHVASIWVCVIIVGIAGSAHQGWSANLFSFVSDTMPRHAVSSVVGLGGFIAYFTGGFMTEIIGMILKRTDSYASIFAAASLMYLISVLILHLLVPKIGENHSRTTQS
jgi:MFS transporter, ACS family, hexuronate transporter